MGSSSKKKDKESRKRRHRDEYAEEYEAHHKEKRHKHKHKHHKKRSKHSSSKYDYRSDDSDVVEIIDLPPAVPHPYKSPSPVAPPPPPPVIVESSVRRELPARRELPVRSEPPARREAPPRSETSLRRELASRSEVPVRSEPTQRREVPSRSELTQRREAPSRSEPTQRREPPSRNESTQRREPPPRHERSQRCEPPPPPPPEPAKQGSSESLSIEATNRLRAELGLKPLYGGTTPSTSSSSSSSKRRDEPKDDKKKDDLGEFYHKPAENWRDKEQQEKIRQKITEQKEKRQLQNKLSKVKLLADSDSDEDATESWVEKNRRIEQERTEAEKRAKMLEELDAQFGISDVIESEERIKRNKQYTVRNLKGLRVEHDMSSFKDEQTTILTLKDRGVLEDDEDVLVNVNMLDDERYQKNVENKKKKVDYNPYEDNEFDEDGNYQGRSLLSKYDEEIEGAKRDSFVIGQEHAVEKRPSPMQSVKDKLAKKKLESLVLDDLKLASDYYNEEEMEKFKKPKKRVRKIRSKGKLSADALAEIDNKGIESVGSRRPKYKNDPDIYEIDDVPNIEVPTDIKLEDDKDDALEKALHKARKIKQKENVVTELLKTEIKPEPQDEALDPGNNIVLNATAEFCRTLGDIPTYGKAGNREETEDIMDFENLPEKEEAFDDEIQEIEPTGWNSVDPNEVRETTQIVPQEVQILDEEPDISRSVFAALKVAMSKGYLDKEENNRPSNTRLAHLQAQHYSIEDKTYGDDGDRQGRRERYAGPLVEFKEKDDFKPNVKLEYIDDDGHILNSKEAFRYLSHKFHGKGPGKNKIEKRIKKSLQEQLMKKMSSTDTPLGTLNMLQAKQKETQSPFVVLSGNKQSQSTVISKTSNRR